MKKFSVIFILLAFIMTIGCFSLGAKKTSFADSVLDCKSKSALLMDASTGTVIFSQNENEKHPIASMCKIMTLLLCFECENRGDFDFNDTIIISEKASSMGGSQVFLESNGNYKIEELIKSIVVASANDACVAMAEKIAGSEENFVELMNKKASDLQMNNTVFVNCTGLPKPSQHSTASDVAKMFSELIKYDKYFTFSTIWMDKVCHSEGRFTEISNTNKLIRFYKGCDSGKTGYTSEAGHCLAASAIRNDMRLISVVISAPDSKTRFSEVSSMFNYGFANFTNKVIIDNKKPLELSVEVSGGKKGKLEIIAENSVCLFSNKNEKRSVEINFEPKEKVLAPITKGDVVGKLLVYENNVQIACVNVLANEDVAEKTYFDIISDITNEWGLI